MIFDERLTILRKQTGMNQKAFAQKMGIEVSKYNKWETGTNRPDYETVCMLADYFHVTMDFLFGRDIISQNFDNQDQLTDQEHQDLLGLNTLIIDTIMRYKDSISDSVPDSIPSKIILHLRQQMAALNNLLDNTHARVDLSGSLNITEGESAAETALQAAIDAEKSIVYDFCNDCLRTYFDRPSYSIETVLAQAFGKIFMRKALVESHQRK